MSVGIWIGPVVLAGLFALLWLATWLEGLVAPPGLEPEWPVRTAIDAPRPDAIPESEVVGAAH